MKPEDRKKRIRIIVTSTVVILLATSIAIVKLLTDNNIKKEKTYSTVTLREKDPVILKGNSEPETIQTVYADPTKGIAGEPLKADGSKVAKGEVLFSYMSQTMQDQADDMQAAYNKVSDQYDSAETDLYNAREKRDENASDLETARANLDEAESSGNPADIQKYTQDVQKYEAKTDQLDGEVSQLEKNLKNLESEKDDALRRLERAKENTQSDEKAEIDGILIVHEEARKSQQSPYMEVVSEKSVLVSSVTEYDYEKVKEGSAVTIKVVPLNQEVKGKISYVSLLPQKSAAGMPQTAGVNYEVRVEPEKDIKYGYSVEIAIPSDEIIIPAKAILTEDSKEYVYQVINGKAYKKVITTTSEGDMKILKSGLRKGDIIVSDPDKSLKEGMEIKVTK